MSLASVSTPQGDIIDWNAFHEVVERPDFDPSREYFSVDVYQRVDEHGDLHRLSIPMTNLIAQAWDLCVSQPMKKVRNLSKLYGRIQSLSLTYDLEEDAAIRQTLCVCARNIITTDCQRESRFWIRWLMGYKGIGQEEAHAQIILGPHSIAAAVSYVALCLYRLQQSEAYNPSLQLKLCPISRPNKSACNT